MNAFAGALDRAGWPGRQVHSAAPFGRRKKFPNRRMHMATAALTSEYCNLSVQDLRESPTNPRQRFEENSLKELCAYVVDNISQGTKSSGRGQSGASRTPSRPPSRNWNRFPNSERQRSSVNSWRSAFRSHSDLRRYRPDRRPFSLMREALASTHRKPK